MFLVIGGLLGQELAPEIIELPRLHNYTSLSNISVHFSTSTFGLRSHESIFICGHLTKTFLDCYQISHTTKTWAKTNLTRLQERANAATIPMVRNHSIWLIAGGEASTTSNEIVPLNSTELFDSVAFSEGPKLQEPISMQCMARLGHAQIISTGGRGANSMAISSVNSLKMPNAWVTMPSMETPRFGHCCGNYGGLKIVVAGGLGIDSAEIYSIFHGQW